MWSHLPHSRGLQTITDPSITRSLPVKPISAAHHCLEGGRKSWGGRGKYGGRKAERQGWKGGKVCACVWRGRKGRREEVEGEQHEGWEHQWRYMQLSNVPQAPTIAALPTHLFCFFTSSQYFMASASLFLSSSYSLSACREGRGCCPNSDSVRPILTEVGRHLPLINCSISDYSITAHRLRCLLLVRYGQCQSVGACLVAG